MCGVAAFVKRHERISEDEGLGMDRLLEVMAYRGSDSSQAWCRDRAVGDRRRLSLIDRSDAGCQPFHLRRQGFVSTPSFVAQFPEWQAQRKRATDGSAVTGTLDLAFLLPADLLSKVALMTMARSVETRAPFRDHHPVELAVFCVLEWHRPHAGGFGFRRPPPGWS